MQNESAYEAAVWRWFFSKAQRRADHYGTWVDLTPREKEHITSCGIKEGSALPEVGTVAQFISTFDGTGERLVICTDAWICNCGEYGGNHMVPLRDPNPVKSGLVWGTPRHVLSGLGIDGYVALEDVILGVIAAAKEEAGEE